jgi:hypothetical protein
VISIYKYKSYHHWCCEFESRSGLYVQHYVIKFVSDLRQVCGFLRILRFHPPIKRTATIYLNIVESGVKPHKTKPSQTIGMTCIVTVNTKLIKGTQWAYLLCLCNITIQLIHVTRVILKKCGNVQKLSNWKCFWIELITYTLKNIFKIFYVKIT